VLGVAAVLRHPGRNGSSRVVHGPARGRRGARPALALGVGAAVILTVSLAACQGASTETVAAGYTTLASAANAASAPLLETLASTEDTAARAPILRGLADVEKTFADGLAALPSSGEVKTAADEVVRLAREREAAFRAAAQATGAAQADALAPVLGEGGDAFHAAVEKLRGVLGLPPTGASPPASQSPGGSVPGGSARVSRPGPRVPA
jgi:hypothetical protein